MNQKKQQRNLLIKVAIASLFLLGASIFSYPFVSDAINNYYDQQSIKKLHAMQEEKSAQEKREEKEQLEAKNKELLAEGKLKNIPGMGLVADPFEEVLEGVEKPSIAYFKKHTLGAIYIPKINVSLPLFDETQPALLEKGATVLQGTSFPIGGVNTHSVITSHSGLPEKKLFTDLEQLKAGDVFFIEVAGEKLAYELFEFQTVLPDETDTLKISEGEDLVTLLTCTPYSVNTHRFLATGRRIDYPIERLDQEVSATTRYHYKRVVVILSVVTLVGSTVGYWIWRSYQKYQRAKLKTKKKETGK